MSRGTDGLHHADTYIELRGGSDVALVERVDEYGDYVYPVTIKPGRCLSYCWPEQCSWSSGVISRLSDCSRRQGTAVLQRLDF